MSNGNEWIFSGKANKAADQLLTFQLAITYPAGSLKDRTEELTVYSEANLTYSIATKVLEKYGKSGERLRIEDQDSPNTRLEKFKDCFAKTLRVICTEVFCYSDNFHTLDKDCPLVDSLVGRTVNTAFAGIAASRFEDNAYISLKVKKGETGYEKYIIELIEKAKNLWTTKLTFRYQGNCASLKGLIDQTGLIAKFKGEGGTYETYEMKLAECDLFLGGLAQLFAIGQYQNPAGLPMAAAEGQVSFVSENATLKATL